MLVLPASQQQTKPAGFGEGGLAEEEVVLEEMLKGGGCTESFALPVAFLDCFALDS